MKDADRAKTTKRCPNCKLTKMLLYVARSKQRKDGHSGWCKKCLKFNTKEYRDKAIDANWAWTK